VLEQLRNSGPVHRLQVSAHEHGLDHVVLTDDVEHWLRWTARVVSVIVIGAMAVALLQYGAPRSHEYIAWEQTASYVALVLATGGLLMAWWWQPFGAGLALISGVFVGALAAYQYNLLIALGIAMLFTVPAALFLLAWHRTQTWLSIIAVATVIGIVLLVGANAALAFYQDGHGPTHTESAVPVPPASATAWIWSGGVTDSSAVVTAKVEATTGVRLALSTTADLAGPIFIESSKRGPVYRFDLSGLAEATTYHYAIEADGAIDATKAGTFRTFTTDPVDFVVAFGSCARVGSNGAVFDTIRRHEPDLFINTGDLFYGDVLENSLDAFSAYYDVTLSRPGQSALYRSTPIAYTWDDHDYGPNDAASDSPSRQAALVSYREFVPHYQFALDGSDAPIAQAFSIGRVRFILTDTRSARDSKTEPDGRDKTMLGDEQLAWFLGELADAAERYPVVVWVSSVPWIAAAEQGADHWGGYAFEREQIATTIADLGIEGLIMVAGDAHMVAIDDGSNNDYKGGPYSEGTYPGGGRFGLLAVDDRGDVIEIHLSGLTWEDRELTSLQVVIPAESS
jgi:hypothetical protein